jgi:hypothetical protein
MPDTITKVIVGVPGPGGGVTAADIANLAAKSGATFTGALIVSATASEIFKVSKVSSGTNAFNVNTSASPMSVDINNAAKLQGFSDNFTTQKWQIDGTTGDIQTDGILTVDGGRIAGDEIEWGFVIDNAGVAITTGVKIDYPVPYNCKVTAWELVADVSGSIVVDIWQDTYAAFPPTVADTITGAEKPTLSAVQKKQDTSLAAGVGWPLTKGRWLRFNVDSATTVTRVTIKLTVERT